MFIVNSLSTNVRYGAHEPRKWSRAGLQHQIVGIGCMVGVIRDGG